MNAKIRTLSAILLTVCMLVSGMPFAACAENEPATPTDLAPVEQETPAENGTGENGETTNEEIPAGEIPAGEQGGPEEAGNAEGTDSPEGNGGNQEEETEVRLPELPFGQGGYRGTLKAGEEFRVVMRPEYSRNILVTLTLVPKTGSIADAAGIRMTLNGEKKNPVRIENEDPESKGITVQFGAYTAKGSEYILAVTSPADADFILTAVKRPEAAPEETGEETTGEEGSGSGETTETEEGGESTGTPAEAAEGGVTAEDETAGETGEPAGEEEAAGEEETKVENVDESGETPAEPTENGTATEPEPAAEPEPVAEPEPAAEPETAAEAEEPQAEPEKNEPATPTDLAPAEEAQGQTANGSAKTDSKKETKEKKAEEEKAALPTAEELLALGYYGSQVAMTGGADIFESTEEDAEPAAHLEPGTELWLRITGDEAWAEIYRTDEKARAQYIRWDDVIIVLKPEPEGEEEEEEPLPARSVEVTSTLWEMLSIPFGTEITMTGELINFREDDICTFQWQYRTQDSDTFTDIDGANELTYTYRINRENYYYIWRLTVLVTREE